MNYAPDIQQLPNWLLYPESYLESRIEPSDSTPSYIHYLVKINAENISFHREYLPVRASKSLQEEFDSLARTWRRETGHYSLVQQKIIHPAYLQIIGMGEKALPFLINEIQQGSSHWFPALRAIAGDDRPMYEGTSFNDAVVTWTRWWNTRRNRYAGMDFTR